MGLIGPINCLKLFLLICREEWPMGHGYIWLFFLAMRHSWIHSKGQWHRHLFAYLAVGQTGKCAFIM